MDALVAKLPEIIMSLLTLVIFPLLAYWVKGWIDNSKLSTNAKALFLRLDDAVMAAVAAVAQTTTDALKEGAKDGKLSKEDCATAKSAALAKVKSYLGAPGLDLLMQVLGVDKADPVSTTKVDQYLSDKIEGAVRADKLAKANVDSVAAALADAGK
jgi:hypothetical protein